MIRKSDEEQRLLEKYRAFRKRRIKDAKISRRKNRRKK